MDMQKITERLAELIAKLARGEATDHDMAELHLLQQLRVKKLMPHIRG